MSLVYAIRELDTNANWVIRSQGGNSNLTIGRFDGQTIYNAANGDSLHLGGSTHYELGAFVIHTFRYDPVSGKSTHWVNGVEQGELDFETAMTFGFLNLGSGGDWNRASGSNVSEYLIYEKALDATQREAMEVYLADKYGIYHPKARWIAEGYDEAFREVIHTGHYDKNRADALFTKADLAVFAGADLDGLAAWYRPEELVEDYGEAGGQVSRWRDVLGVNDLVQTDGTRFPDYVTELGHGQAGISMDVHTDQLNTSYRHIDLNAPLTVSLVYAIRELDTWANYVLRSKSGSTELYMGRFDGQTIYNVSSGAHLGGSTHYELGSFVIHTFQYDPVSGTSTHWVNGVAQGEITYETATTFGFLNLGSGGDLNRAPGSNLSEYLIYEKALDEPQRESMEVYLADKYGIYHPKANWIAEGYDEAFREVIHTGHYDKNRADALFTKADLAVFAGADLDGLAAWYRPEELVEDYGEAGGQVSRWRDVLGVNDLVQTNTQAQPDYVTELGHGQAGISMDADRDQLLTSYRHIDPNAPLTVSLVYAIRELDSSNWVMMSQNGAAVLRIGRFQTTPTVFGASIADLSILPSVTPFSLGLCVVHTFRYDPVSLKVTHWVNGIEQGEIDLDTATTFGFPHLGTNDYHRGPGADVSEYLIYEKALDEPQRESMEVYLADKYGIYHPKAQWIAFLDPVSAEQVHSARLSRSAFIAGYGQYSPDAAWIQSYSAVHQQYIHSRQLDLMDVPMMPGPMQSNHSLAQGLVLFLPMENDTVDLSPSRTAVEGALLYELPNRFGVANTSASFAAQSLRLPSGLDFDNAFTVTAWAKPSASAGSGVLISGGRPSVDDPADAFSLSTGSDGQMRLSLFMADGTEPDLASPLDPDAWSLVAGRFDGSRMSLLVNDASPLSRSIQGALSRLDGPFGIGADPVGNGHLDGALNDLMVWDRALSDAELALLNFIQIDPTSNQQFRSLLSDILPAPGISRLTYDGRELASGDFIRNGGLWHLDLLRSDLSDTVSMLIDGRYAAGFIRSGDLEFEMSGSFWVTPGIHEVQVVVSNRNGISDDVRISGLRFAGSIPPDQPPLIERILFESDELEDGDTIGRSGMLNVKVFPDDQVSVLQVNFYLDGELIGSDSDPSDGFLCYLDLQDRDGQRPVLRVEAINPFFPPVVLELSLTVDTEWLAQEVSVQWEPSDDPETPDSLRYELDYCLDPNDPDPHWISILGLDSEPALDPLSGLLSCTWDVSSMADSQSVHVRVRAFDGAHFSDYDTVGPLDLNNGPPVSPTVAIVDGATGLVVDSAVTLDLSASGATEMRIGSSADFTDSLWIPYGTRTEYAFLNQGWQDVFVQFRDVFGLESDVVSDSTRAFNPNVVFNPDNPVSEVGPGYFDGIDRPTVLIDGTTVSMSGRHQLDNLLLLNGAILTTPAATTSTVYGIDLEVEGAVYIDATSRVDVSGKGYMAGYTQWNTPLADLDSTRTAGGSHGGTGGSGWFVPIASYGDFRLPVFPGSGPHPDSPDGRGGGVISLKVGEQMDLYGKLLADGVQGGAGGSILLDVNHLQGYYEASYYSSFEDASVVTANGGTAPYGSPGAGGGGGRIAVYYQDMDSTRLLLKSIGGNKAGESQYDDVDLGIGSLGTIYLENTASGQPGVGGLAVGQWIDPNMANTLTHSPTFPTYLPSVGSGRVTRLDGNALLDEQAAFPVDAHSGEGLLKGLWVRPSGLDAPAFRIIENTADSLFLDDPESTLAASLPAGSGYEGVMLLDSLIAMGANVVVSPDPWMVLDPLGPQIGFEAELVQNESGCTHELLYEKTFSPEEDTYNLEINGATRCEDRDGNLDHAYSFDGDAWIEEDRWGIGPYQNTIFHASCWIYPEPQAGNEDPMVFLCLGNQADEWSSPPMLTFGMNPDRSLFATVGLMTNPSTELAVSGGPSLDSGQWVQVAIEYAADSGLLRLFIDGEEVARAKGEPFNYLQLNSNLVYIGRAWHGDLFKGRIDDILISKNPGTLLPMIW